MDFGRVSYVGNYEFQLGGALVALAKRGRVKLTESSLEDFFIELAAESDDPVDAIRMAVDLANTLLALRESQKVTVGGFLFSCRAPGVQFLGEFSAFGFS